MATETLSHVDSIDGLAGEARGLDVAIGDMVGRYQVRRALGEGGMGRVFLARDVTLGRSVALKILKHEDDRPARFGDEARAIAALNHPHIVHVYEYGQHQGIPFLALEYVEGESLRDRCKREQLSLDVSLRVLRAIADALVHAHAAGIVHCDLKPSNVMLAVDGRLRVVDFGLARTGPNPQSGAAGTPDWMAPEQWQGEPVTDRTDVWALAVIATQLLVARHPFGTVAVGRREQILDPEAVPAPVERDGLAESISEIIARSLDHDALARPSAADWYHALDEALDGRGALSIDDGPYRGLAPFGERHARFFFGRDPEIDAFVERLRVTPVLPIVGPSGAGKSSFLFAGVLPRLRARERSTIVALRPGADPFGALARGLLEVAGDPVDVVARAELAGALRETPTLLAARLATIAADRSSVVLAVDQLEELFTQGAPPCDVERFLEMLLSAADDPSEATRVVFTLRDDFLGRVAGARALFVLKKLAVDALRTTIAGPLRRVGYQFDDASIIEDMLAELGEDVAIVLPLLQFACRALWEARDVHGRLLLRSAYRAIGGVAGALARHADGVLAEMSAAEQRVARDLLLGLVVGTSRRQAERERIVAGDNEVSSVLDRLVAARLVIQRTSAGSDAAIVEIAHESLLRTWARFASWLDETRDERRLLAELEEATDYWNRRGRRSGEVWGGDELAAARHRIAQLAVSVPSHVDEFLAACEERQQSRRRRARWRVAVICMVAIGVTAGSLFLARTFRNQRTAKEQINDVLVRANAQLTRARNNLGSIDLVIQPYDWVNGRPQPIDPAELPALSWQLYRAKPGGVQEPGDPIPPAMVHVEAKARHGEYIDRIEAPGGTAFLRIDGRGRAGETCAPSWIRLIGLPGYAEFAEPSVQPLELAVPTCRATHAETITVAAGEFVYGGPGDPATRYPDYAEPERVVTLPTYAIDRYEVSNAVFAPFARLAPITGYAVPAYPDSGADVHAGEPDRPVSAIDAFEAEAFCRFMGKRLPSDYEWTKAARGGLELADGPNPAPRRLFPWGTRWNPRCANIEGTADGFEWVSPVSAYACGASPYGVLNLAGNVAEWISRAGQTDTSNPLRVVRGGAADSPAELEQATTIFRNAREGRQFTFAIGVRCVEGAEGDGGESWERH